MVCCGERAIKRGRVGAWKEARWKLGFGLALVDPLHSSRASRYCVVPAFCIKVKAHPSQMQRQYW